MRRYYLLAAIPFVAALLFLTVPLSQRTAHAQAAPTHFQYAVKFICGKSPSPNMPVVVAPGSYFTAINVHNPLETDVKFRKKFAIALPGEKAGKVSSFFDTGLGADEAYEIDCGDIIKHLHADVPFVKGFAVIESKTELDIVAVYTAAGASGQIETMHMERVPARRVTAPGSPDLLPVPDANGNFCRRDPAGRFTVTIKNQGTAAAGPSSTKVTFSNGAGPSVATPAIAAGATVDVFVPFPSGCFTPDCGFKILADATGAVSESNELNNGASGICLG